MFLILFRVNVKIKKINVFFVVKKSKKEEDIALIHVGLSMQSKKK